jgi:heme A synthase
LEEVENLSDWKTRISTLWLMNAFSIVSLMLLELFRSGDLTHIVPPLAVDTWSLLLFTVAIVVVLAMAFLSQSLEDKVNRWLNIVVGAVYSVGAMVTTVAILMGNSPSVLAINSAAGFVWTALVAWIAWKSKQ